MQYLKTQHRFSKPQLLIFLIAFALIGIILIKTFAAPNPNLPGDLNGDNTVNVTDMSILLSNYGTSNANADINGDGTVNVLDLSILLSHYGQNYSPPAASCTVTITNSNSLINTYNAAKAGDTICIAPGTTINQGQIDFRNAIGSSGAPITITSADRTNPSEIYGRVVTHPPANYITFSHLKFDFVSSTTPPSITVGSDYITFLHDDITNENTNICINAIDDTTYGTAHYTLIDSSRIHNCGTPGSNQDHGIYDVGYYSTIVNNFIYDNAARGIQLRGSHNDTVKYNTVDNNGEGIIFGDLAASNNDVFYNIFSNSNARWNIETSGTAQYGNMVHDSCVWATNSDSYYDSNGGIMSGLAGVTVVNMKNANPMYTNAAAKDFTLQAGSPCAGYGVKSGVVPGI